MLDFPMYSESVAVGDKGVRITENIVCDELGWIFRRQETNDLGIDAQIEIVDENRRSKGRIIALQIKCGESFFIEKSEDGYIFRGEKKHFFYWTNHSLPVILIICNPKSKDCYWVEVKRANSTLLENSWRIIVPYENLLNIHAAQYIEKYVANQLRHEDIIELLLYKYLHEKYGKRIEICPDIDLPRDFYGLSYLGHLINDDNQVEEIAIIGFHYDYKNKITINDLEKYLDLYKANRNHMGWDIYDTQSKFWLYIVSESIDALRLDREVLKYLQEKDYIKHRTLHYDPSFFYYLSDPWGA